MSTVSHLHHFEPVRLDRGRLDDLVTEHGLQAAERLMGRALEDVAVMLNGIERATRNGDAGRLVATTREIALLADQVGLLTLSRVASDLLKARAQGDAAAFEAILARLIRIGEASLMSAWDIRDIKL